ncbi:MAG: carbohydrate ABC transporter permease [Firmicutes bacterium]|nr:carbohydrate ABC transporter permease [Bacillota bacterium]
MVYKSKDDIIFDIVSISLVTLFFIIVLYPLIYIVIASISDPFLVSRGKVWIIPRGITFEGYKRVFSYSQLWVGYRNTIFYTISGTIISLFLTLTAAYSLSHQDFIGKKLFVLLFTVTMYFSGGLIPTYLIVKGLGLRNTPFAQIIPGALGFWYIVIVRTYYQNSIPSSIKEAATIDGCSYTGLFTTIILPLSKPIIAVMALYYGVGQWNSWFNALIYISKESLFPLQLILRKILILNEINNQMLDMGQIEAITKQIEISALIKYAVIIVAALPVIIIYPFLQKYFVKGIMIGALKG